MDSIVGGGEKGGGGEEGRECGEREREDVGSIYILKVLVVSRDWFVWCGTLCTLLHIY